ncbi:MAG: hypothetical protein RJA09_74 [Pseudomonadota bacterium]|jgi:hypothetical protein
MNRLPRLFTALACLWLGAATAQAPAAPTDSTPATRSTAIEQNAQRITHHDSGSRIEEVRVGGETRSIEVETNSRVPGYHVQPVGGPAAADNMGQPSGNGGRSAWRVLRF